MAQKSVHTLTWLVVLLVALLLFIEPLMAQTPTPQTAQPATLQSETPEKFEPTYDGFDYTRRDVMIPMRDTDTFDSDAL